MSSILGVTIIAKSVLGRPDNVGRQHVCHFVIFPPIS